MKKTAYFFVFLMLSTLFVLSVTLWAGSAVSIEGVVRDSKTQDPLPGANVFLVGTSLGAASDIHGKYIIPRVPQGKYILRSQFIGYKTKDIPVLVQPGKVVKQDIFMDYVGVVKGKAVVVTAQAEGQMAAINQQLTSDRIENVVSSARIQELPDANAAESLRRLPGISIERVGGEGSKVVIRGLAPKYNVITINGVRMASSNPNDRSTDLSMISSNMLEGIAVSKTVTADQDADVLGGTVNFEIREAKAGKHGLGFHLLAQHGYTGLPDAYDKYNNYKYVPIIEGRFFKQRLGILVQANFENRNLTSNEFSASYTHKSTDHIYYITQSINLHYMPRFRKRTNGIVALDYRLPEGKISFTNFFNSAITKVTDRSELFNVGGNQHIYGLAYSKGENAMMSNILNVKGKVPFIHSLHADLKLAHNYSETKRPKDWEVTFYQSPAGIGKFSNKVNLNPKDVVAAVDPNPKKANLNTVLINNNDSKERTMMASLDLDFPLNFSNNVTSVIKFGGKYRYQKRSYGAEVYNTNATFVSPSAQGASRMIVKHFGLHVSDPTAIHLSYFLDKDFDYGRFLEGDYTMHNPIKFSMMEDLVNFCQENTRAFAKAGSREAFARNNYLSVTHNYSGHEVMTAGYVMATIHVGRELTLIPGIRYQNLQTTYFDTRGQQTPLSYLRYNHSTDTTVTVNHPYWLPNMNIRYKPLSWFDVRLSYSHTISYPDFNAIIPRIDASMGANVAWNNYKLKPSHSRNYDLYFSFFRNKLGLLTIGGFLKQIDNLIYPWRFSKPGLEAKPYYLTNKTPSPQITYNISTFINNPYVINNWGMEFEWQTHFWYLPNPLKGLVLSVNYTKMHSKAEYPYVFAGATSMSNIDTSFTDRLIDQPNHILNLVTGYDYKGFSIRVSMLYQDDVFTGSSQWPQLRTSTAAYKRWDISFRQKLPWLGLQVYGDINNLNGAKDMSVLQMYPETPRSMEIYGMSADIGLRLKL